MYFVALFFLLEQGSSAAEGARPLEVFMCSIKEELGYAEGLPVSDSSPFPLY